MASTLKYDLKTQITKEITPGPFPSNKYPLVCHCAQENRLHKSQFETLGNLFPVRAGNFPDPVILLARFGIFLTGFLGRSNPTDYGIPHPVLS